MSFFRVIVAVLLLTAGVVVLVIVFPKLARAKPSCGVEATYPDFEAGDVIASCSGRHRVCRASMTSVDEHAGSRFKDVLTVGRSTGTDTWQVTLGSAFHKIDISNGLGYMVDKNEPQRIPPEFLRVLELSVYETKRFKRKVLIDPKVAKIVVDDMAAGINVVWRYKTDADKNGTFSFATSGLNDAVAWIACKQ